MEISPLGTVDPSPFIYDTSMYAFSSLMIVGILSNKMIKKVKPEMYEVVEEEEDDEEDDNK